MTTRPRLDIGRSSKSRVVITGCGAVCPLGSTVEAMWQGLVDGRSGLGFITAFDTTDFPIKVSGEVKELGHPDVRARTLRLIYTAAEEAAAQAAIGTPNPRSRAGVFCGYALDWPDLDRLIAAYRQGQGTAGEEKHASAAPHPFDFPAVRVGAAAALVASHLGITAQTRVAQGLDGACATGGMVIGEAYRHLRMGAIDLAVVVAASSWTNLLGISLYHKLTTLSTEAEVPARASRPFDANRSGFVMAEGAGALVLESLPHALARGARPLAEITGYGSTTSAFRITDLPPDGLPQRRAMELALEDAGRSAEEVDYINAHGTGTYQNDIIETRAIRALLGDRCYDVPVSSNKSMIGHTITAAGALEGIATAYTIRRGLLPPTVNLQRQDPECDLDYVANTCRPREVRVALSNSFGFGGQNCAVVMEAYAG
jgi:3-oxoacyl-[acyl-carrier-protein] synthase II